MKRSHLINRFLMLGLPGLWTACSGPTAVNLSPTSPVGSSSSIPASTNELSGRLKQYQVTNRILFYIDFMYDSQGRQLFVGAYNQRAGEGKEESPQTIITYDGQNRISKTQDGRFTIDSLNHTVTKASVMQWQEFTYDGLLASVKTRLADPAAYNGNPDQQLEFDKEGHILKQTQLGADGSKNETTYLYENENVVRIDQRVISAAGELKSYSRSLYTYDTNPNPLRGLLAQYGSINVQSYASKNNVAKWTFQNLSLDGESILTETSTTYTYTYSSKGWPLSYQAGTMSGRYIYFDA